MNVELICVGSELLSGDVVNTNASYISKKLRELGHNSFRQFTVDDNKYRLSELVEASCKRCDVLIITGGLGPTADDITKETVCETLGLKLVENAYCRNHIETYFKNAGREPTENNFKQALAPENAIIFGNSVGTACGIGIEDGGKHIILLPGPPKELTHMFDMHIVPYLKKLNHHAIVTHTLNVFGLGESAIETMIKPFCEAENPVVATYCGNNECAVKVTATADTEAEAEAICSKTILRLRDVLGDYIYGADSEGLATEVVNALRIAGLKVSTAESCTGGMLSQALTSVSHSSEVVEIGILAYSNRIKHEALSVPKDVLVENGAISAETAMYLAKNVRLLSDADIGVGITGNAGPTASENKPIGLVYVAIADSTKYYIKRLQLSPTFDREKIRSYATLTALDLIRKYVSSRPYALPGMVGFDMPFIFEEEDSSIFNEPEIVEAPEPDDSSAEFDPNMNFIVFDPEDDEDLQTVIPEDVSEELAPEDNVSSDETVNNESADNKKKFDLLLAIKKLAKRIFPVKHDSVKDIIIKVVSIIALVGLVVSSTVLITHYVDENNQRNIIQQARDNFDFENDEINEETHQYVAFDPFIQQNPDIRGWISISNTNVDNPIYQYKDNDYYLTHNMLGQKSRYGALFFDFENNIEFENNSKNLTIYGHNMRDGSMFASLNTNYRKLSFYKQNPIIQLKTLYEKHDYAIFAIMVTNASPEDDNGYVYNYKRSEFESDEEFLAWIDEAQTRSLIKTDIEIDKDDEILTLSTCCYDFEDARFVIMAKKIASDEPLPSFGAAQWNKNPKYPQAYYDKHGVKGYVPDATSSAPAPSKPTNNSSSEDASSDDASSTPTTDEEETPPESNENNTNTPDENDTPETVCDHSGEQKYEASNSEDKHAFLCSKCGQAIHEKHTFTNKQDDAFLKPDGAATCQHGTLYFKSCICGKASTETFEANNKQNCEAVVRSNETQHWEECKYGCGNLKTEPVDHDFSTSETCGVCGQAQNNV